MEMVASEVMKRMVHVVSPKLSLTELEKKFVEEKISGFPVVENDELIGMVTRTDLVRELSVETELAESVSDFYMDEKGFHEVPLTDLHQVASRVGEQLITLTVRDVMCPKIIAIRPDDSIQAAARLMSEHRIHRILVTKEDRIVGVISSLDLADLLAQGKIVPV